MKKSAYYKSEKHLQNAEVARSIAIRKIRCEYCSRMISYAGLKSHEGACAKNPLNEAQCKNCRAKIAKPKLFCNRSCAATFNNKGKNRWRRVGSKRSCEYCKKELSSAQKRFCGLDCSSCFRSEKRINAQIARGSLDGMGRSTRRRALAKVKSYVCEECGLTDSWNGKPLALEMDHRDGDVLNNRIDNLRFLCPNCHTQTDTWGKGKRIPLNL